MRRLFAFDMDGTLMKDNEIISDKTIEAIKMINDNGDIAMVATGRSEQRAMKPIKLLGIKKYLVTASGAMTTDLELNKITKNTTIPKQIVDYFIDITKKYKRLLVIKQTDKEVRYYFGDNVYKDIDKESLFWIRGDLSANSILDFNNFDKDVNYDNIIHLAIKAEPEIIDMMYKESYSEVNKINSNFGTQVVSDVFLDLENKNCNKATSIESIRKLENIDFENVYVFGDSSNDYEMIKFFKHGVSMGNGTNDVKQIAWKVIGDVDDDGVYHFIKEFYENKRQHL